MSRPLRNLLYAIVFVLLVGGLATVAYLHAGWSLADASYMVTLTIFTVGYGEVRPIDTGYLHAVTMATMILGCTGVIIVTGALVQVLTLNQLEQFFGKRVEKDIERLDGHVIVCGFGRIGIGMAIANKPTTVRINTQTLRRCQGAGRIRFRRGHGIFAQYRPEADALPKMAQCQTDELGLIVAHHGHPHITGRQFSQQIDDA